MIEMLEYQKITATLKIINSFQEAQYLEKKRKHNHTADYNCNHFYSMSFLAETLYIIILMMSKAKVLLERKTCFFRELSQYHYKFLHTCKWCKQKSHEQINAKVFVC